MSTLNDKHFLKSRLFRKYKVSCTKLMIANLRVPQKSRLPSQNNTVDDDKLRVITERGCGKMRNESRKQEREDERWGALTW